MWRCELSQSNPIIETLLRPCWNKSEFNLNSTGKGALCSSTAVFASTPRSGTFYQPPALPQNCLNWNGYFVFLFLLFLTIKVHDPELLQKYCWIRKSKAFLIFWISLNTVRRFMSKNHYLTFYVLKVSRREVNALSDPGFVLHISEWMKTVSSRMLSLLMISYSASYKPFMMQVVDHSLSLNKIFYFKKFYTGFWDT